MARTRASLAGLPTDPTHDRAALALAGPCLSFGGRHHSDTCAGASRLRLPVDQSHPKIRINISNATTTPTATTIAKIRSRKPRRNGPQPDRAGERKHNRRACRVALAFSPCSSCSRRCFRLRSSSRVTHSRPSCAAAKSSRPTPIRRQVRWCGGSSSRRVQEINRSPRTLAIVVRNGTATETPRKR